MHEVLGDREKQDAIRKKNPDVKHCSLLLMSPTACDGCQNNPFKGKTKSEVADNALVFKYRLLIDRIVILYDYIDMGLIRDLDDISPLEAMLLRTVHSYYRSKRSI